MAYNIAHDFNNHLTAILGNLELSREHTSSNSPLAGLLEEAACAARRAADLADQLLIISGRSQIAAQPIQLSHFVEGQRPAFAPVDDASVQFEMNLDQQLPMMEGDPTQIRQLLAALVANAVEAHLGGEGRVWVRTCTSESAPKDAIPLSPKELQGQGPFVVLEVGDNGAGMDEEIKNRIFSPYFSTKFSGRGLGLACVLGIVKSHHGSIEVLSESGKGTIVRVYFPAAVKHERAAPPAGSDATGEVAAPTVLIADDELSVLKVAETFLKRAGFRVYSAQDGFEAVELFRAHADEIGVVLLDMTMPRMSGDEACLEILYMRPDARVILCSGYSEDQLYNRVVRAGMAGFIQKPYDRHGLIEKVREAMHPVAVMSTTR
jgi:CheY-like chemotaxis protein